jgi:hypothetical protein
MHEVKGFWQDDARVKIKVAARSIPFRFKAVNAKREERRRRLGGRGILMTTATAPCAARSASARATYGSARQTIGTSSRNGARCGFSKRKSSMARVYDPAAGRGTIVISALKSGLVGIGSDLVDRGWDSTLTPHDFLESEHRRDNIVTQPAVRDRREIS